METPTMSSPTPEWEQRWMSEHESWLTVFHAAFGEELLERYKFPLYTYPICEQQIPAKGEN